MDAIQITGGTALTGEVCVQGSKNAALPMMAAALLAEGTTVLVNCPKIADVLHMVEIMEEIGCRAWWEGNALCLDTTAANRTNVRCLAARSMRSTCLFLGAMLGRFQKAAIPYPGGCVIGKRPIDLHISGFEQMGVVFEESRTQICASSSRLTGADVTLAYPSVGATENLMIAAAKAAGNTKIHGCAREPEVLELGCLLEKMGAGIHWQEDGTLLVEGTKKLHAVEFCVPPDRIVAGTYLLAAAATRGKIHLRQVPFSQLGILDSMLMKMGGRIRLLGQELDFDGSAAVHGLEYVKTMPYPGFPTDLQPQLAAALTIADAPTVIEETVFESRFAAVEECKKLKADIRIEGTRIQIRPVKCLYGSAVKAKDLRGAAALVLAGLAARGETRVSGCSYLERGYEDIVGDLRSLGAVITQA